MDLLQLRVLREVARCGSISAAAEALDYTQPAISRQLAALERTAGRPLVERTARGTQLTRIGEILLRRAETILAELDGARADLAQIQEHDANPLRIIAFATALASFVPDAIGDFRRRSPETAVEVRLGESQIGDASLRGDRLDVALTNLNPGRTYTDARIVPLRDDPMWCCLPADHPLADHEAIPVRLLREQPLILTATSLCADRELVLAACAAAGFVPRVAAHSDDYATTQGLVASGVGVAAIPEMGLPAVRSDVVLRPFVDTLRRHVVALVPHDAPPRPERDELLATLTAVAGRWSSRAVPAAVARRSTDAVRRDARDLRDDAPGPPVSGVVAPAR